MGQMIDIETLLLRLAVGRTTLYRLRKNAGFPPPALCVGRIQRWRETDVTAWIEAQAAKKGTPEVV